MKGLECHFNTGANEHDGFQSFKFTTLLGSEIKGWHVGSSMQYYEDKGQSHNNTLGTGGFPLDPSYIKDGTKGAFNFTLNIQSPDKKLELASWYKHANQDAYLSGVLPWASSSTHNYIGTQFQNYIKYKPFLNTEVTAGLMTGKLDYPGFPFYNEQKNYDSYIEVTHNKTLSEHNLLVGIKLEREGQYGNDTYYWDDRILSFRDTSAFPLAPNLSRTVLSAFLEDSWTLSDKLNFTIGGRFDNYFNYNNNNISAFNPRVAVSYKPHKSLILKVQYASALRPPTIYELTGTTLLPLYGNSNTKSEKIETVEANLIYKSRKFKIQLTPYLQYYKDQIIYLPIDKVFSDRDTTQATNSGQTNVTGLDAMINYYFDVSSYIFVNAAKFQSINDFTNTKTEYLPDFYINAGINIKVKRFNFNLTEYYRNERKLPASHIINSKYASGYNFNSNLSISYLPNDNIKFYCLVQNLTNKTDNNIPLTSDGFFMPMRARMFHLGIISKF